MHHRLRSASAASFALAISVSLLTTTYASDLVPQLEIGRQAPDFTLVNAIDDRPVAISALKDTARAVCVIFAANHCPVYVAYEERIIDLGRRFAATGVQFLLVASNDTSFVPEDGPAFMKARAAEKGYPFPYLFDPDQSVGKAFGARVTPHVYLFDRGLILRYRGAIDDSRDPDDVNRHYLRDAITALLAGTPEAIAEPATIAKGCTIKWKK
ncbi:MAG: thioredoxin family protein [Calditrichaeota bacterium]|nr:thioredoxin family protein [Calditrichota bacterium]